MHRIESLKFGALSCLDGYDCLDRLWQKYLKPLHYREGCSQYLLLSLLLIGMFHPTSWQNDILVLFWRSTIYLLNLLLFLLLLMNGLGDRIAYRCGLAIPFILFGATLFSPLQDITVGAYVYFLPISLLFCTDFQVVRWSKLFSVCFFAVNLVIIVSAVAVVFDVKQIEGVFINVYNAFTDNMLVNMLAQGKPVLFFSSHSIAACMYTFFFYVNLKIFLHCKNILNLLFALLYIVFIFFLKSSAAYYSLVLSILIVGYYLNASFFKYRKVVFFSLLSIVILFISIYLYGNNFVYGFLSDFVVSVKTRLLSPGNGFLGRYSSHGVLAGNIQYILDNPFSPVGLRNSPQFWFMDSGIIEYLLRGSIFLVLAIYYGLFRLLRFHLPSRSSYWLLFIIVLINELGFPYLKYFRFMYLLPFFIVYLRHLEIEFPLKKIKG